MAQMEFEVTTDLTPVTETHISTNFEAVKEWLTETLAPYESMIVTPDSISDAKRDRANIRKVADSIDSQRKAIKKIWNKPYEEYEAKCKELTGIVNAAASNIDSQIKAMENEVKERKRRELEAFFAENSADISDYISFDCVFDLRMLNSTFSAKDAETEISRQLQDIRSGLDAIRGIGSPYEAAMLSEFSKSHSLAKAIAEGRRLEAIQKAEEERKAAEAVSVFDQDETLPSDATEDHRYDYPLNPQIVRPADAPKFFTLRFEVSGTAEQFSALKRCMTANNMTYKKI